jgi:hypothetical protein
VNNGYRLNRVEHAFLAHPVGLDGEDIQRPEKFPMFATAVLFGVDISHGTGIHEIGVETTDTVVELAGEVGLEPLPNGISNPCFDRWSIDSGRMSPKARLRMRFRYLRVIL